MRCHYDPEFEATWVLKIDNVLVMVSSPAMEGLIRKTELERDNFIPMDKYDRVLSKFKGRFA